MSCPEGCNAAVEPIFPSETLVGTNCTLQSVLCGPSDNASSSHDHHTRDEETDHSLPPLRTHIICKCERENTLPATDSPQPSSLALPSSHLLRRSGCGVVVSHPARSIRQSAKPGLLVQDALKKLFEADSCARLRLKLPRPAIYAAKLASDFLWPGYSLRLALLRLRRRLRSGGGGCLSGGDRAKSASKGASTSVQYREHHTGAAPQGTPGSSE